MLKKNEQPGALQMEQGEPAGDPTSPDNTPEHEGAESPQLEGQEGAEEDPDAESGGEGQEVDDYTIAAADAITTALASLLHYTRTGVLLQLEGDMAAYMKEDLTSTLSSRIKYGIIDDKDLGAAMPEAVKHAKALVKLLDSGAVGGMVLREEPTSSGGCCTIS